MAYRIREYTGYDEREILPLYESVGWSNYSRNPAMLRQAYAHSLRVYAAYDGDALVGVIRVVGDGFSVVFVQDLLVQPDHQRKGVGTALLRKVLEEYEDVYQLHLLTDNTEKSVAFYRSLGFRMDSDIGCIAFSRFHVPE